MDYRSRLLDKLLKSNRRCDSKETETNKRRHSRMEENEGGFPVSFAPLTRSFRVANETVSFLEESINEKGRVVSSAIRISGYFVGVLDILFSMNSAIASYLYASSLNR